MAKSWNSDPLRMMAWGAPPTPCEQNEFQKLFISYDLGTRWHNLHDFHLYNHCVYGGYIASLAVTTNLGTVRAGVC